jgi:hypothetical protein
MRIALLVILSALIGLPAAARAPGLPQPLKEALAKKEGPLYAFDLQVKAGANDAKVRVDPGKPLGQRMTFIAPAREKLEAGFQKRMDRIERNTTGDIWCTAFAEHVPSEVKLLKETDTTLVYGFVPLPGADDKQFAKAFKYLKGEVTIDKKDPAILHFKMYAPAAFKPMSVAKIDKFDLKASCQRGPDGRTHVQEMTMNIKGSAMMQKLDQLEVQSISNLKPSSAALTK